MFIAGVVWFIADVIIVAGVFVIADAIGVVIVVVNSVGAVVVGCF